MKKALMKLAAVTMVFAILGTGAAITKPGFTAAGQVLCQYHRTDNVTWQDGTPYCNRCGQINYDAYCKHQGQRYACYDNDWKYDHSYPVSMSRLPVYSYVYKRDEHIKCSKCGKNIGKTGHYQYKVVCLGYEEIFTH